MPVNYDGNGIIPAPFVSIQKEFQKSADGTTRLILYNITVKGKLVAFKGSPNSAGEFWQQSGYPPDDEPQLTNVNQDSLDAKIGAMMLLFSTEGKSFEISPWDGAAPIKFNPRIKGIDFAEGQWFNVVDYTIQMEADTVYFGTIPESADGSDPATIAPEETWSTEAADERARTYRLTHSVSASAKRTFDENGNITNEGWQNAKTAVLAKLGLTSSFMTAPGVLDLSGTFAAFNYIRAQTVDEPAGKFSVSETWLCFDPQSDPDAKGFAAIEDFTVTSKVSAENHRTTVSVEGTITGLEIRDNTTHALTTTRLTNAQGKWAAVQPLLFNRAQSLAGITLNPTVLGQQIGTNEINGVITYNFDWDDRPASLFPGALSQTITISDDFPSDVFASLVVLNRSLGPVLQSIGTVTESKRTLSIEVVMPAGTYTNPNSTEPDETLVDELIDEYEPEAEVIFINTNRQNWCAQTGRYSREFGWTYEA